ncbi:hypothetical protein BMETH_2077_0 [methanotrophic bacterial endosymbiont of Bathymodiolus sp.]|nr:hypothetical protein BMETH_2077_0 [methanotrophic bacterial endosymbiont of Bathymodiolus sp.]
MWVCPSGGVAPESPGNPPSGQEHGGILVRRPCSDRFYGDCSGLHQHV